MSQHGSEECEYTVLDFKDAFKQLVVHDSERCFLCGDGLNGYFVYNVVLFGIKS